MCKKVSGKALWLLIRWPTDKMLLINLKFLIHENFPSPVLTLKQLTNREKWKWFQSRLLCANYAINENRAMPPALTIPEGDDQKKPVLKEQNGRRRHGIESLFVTAWPPKYDWYTTAVFNHRAILPLNPALPLPENARFPKEIRAGVCQNDAESRIHTKSKQRYVNTWRYLFGGIVI